MPSAADPTELAEQNLDPGDLAFEDGKTIPLESDGVEIDGGVPVQFDGSGYIEPMEGGDYSEGDDPLGVVLDRASESDSIRLTDEYGSDYYHAVHVDRLPVTVELGGSATPGDLVETDGAGGWIVDNTNGTKPVVKEADATNNEYVILL
jgi:hypothetical protein